MTLPFRKMHGLGNDFVIVDGRSQDLSLTRDQIAAYSDRRRGAGCDQFVILETSDSGQGDVFMRLYNADGMEVGACGNATRCVADIVMKETSKDRVVVETISGLLNASYMEGTEKHVSVNMGAPALDWSDIPLSKEIDTLHLKGIKLRGARDPVAVNMGNPHCVFFVEDAEEIDIHRFGPYMETHEMFPTGTNVEFAHVVDKTTLRMRVWERGVGVTQACGTGACAVAVAAVRRGLTVRNVTVQLDGGELDIKWNEDNTVLMTGEVTYVYDGEFHI